MTRYLISFDDGAILGPKLAAPGAHIVIDVPINDSPAAQARELLAVVKPAPGGEGATRPRAHAG